MVHIVKENKNLHTHILVTIWILVLNLVVLGISSNVRSKLDYEFGHVITGLISLLFIDVSGIYYVIKNVKLTKWTLIIQLIIKFGITVLFCVFNGTELSQNWLISPYNSFSLIAEVELFFIISIFLFQIMTFFVLASPFRCGRPKQDCVL